MPTNVQRALFEHLRTRFEHHPAWKEATSGRDVSYMLPHDAFHFLQELMERLITVPVAPMCCCVERFRELARVVFESHPPQQGGSGGHTAHRS